MLVVCGCKADLGNLAPQALAEVEIARKRICIRKRYFDDARTPAAQYMHNLTTIQTKTLV